MTDSFDKIKQYGKVGLITHLSLSWTFFLATFLFVKRTGKTEKIIKYLKLQNRIPANAGSFAVSAIIYKAVMPFRLAASLAIIPGVIMFLGQEKKSQEKLEILNITSETTSTASKSVV